MTPGLPLPPGVRSRRVPGVNGLDMHVLEAGWDGPARSLVLLLHGFPELAYSWRQVMPALADAGWHVVAPDQRGYGRTTGAATGYDDDQAPFRLLNLVRDVLALVAALDRRTVAAVVGHDFGSPVAAWCAVARPDVFRACVLMSAPFAGAPAWGTAAAPSDPDGALAALDPPRKHYQWYYSTRDADLDMRDASQGLHAFLRAYYHMKSADWPPNRPHPLAAWTATELARLPEYYVMPRDLGMAATVAPHHPAVPPDWLPDTDLAVYAEEYARTGFQGGLNWYRGNTTGANAHDLRLFAGRTLDVPSLFIAGAADWGIHQVPGALERMQRTACTRMAGCHLIDGAGHWVQQERPQRVAALLRDFLADQPRS